MSAYNLTQQQIDEIVESYMTNLRLSNMRRTFAINQNAAKLMDGQFIIPFYREKQEIKIIWNNGIGPRGLRLGDWSGIENA